VPPTPIRLERRTLERGRRNPRRGTDACSALARGHAVTSGASPPSPSALCGHRSYCKRHPRCCGNTRRQDIATPTAASRTASRQRHPRISMRAATERATPTPPPSKPLLDGYRARHDVPQEARFAKTAVYSTALDALPPHIDETVWHTCKLPPPWPIKGGAVPWPQGRTTNSTRSHTFRLHPDIALASIKKASGTWRPGLLSRLACSPPLQAPRCNAIQCLKHTAAGRTTPAGTKINLVSPSCLGPAIVI
jgi:hypothetical protein